MARDVSRRTEGSLLFLVLIILGAGFLLVYLAKTRLGVPPDALNLNSATADELALAFEVDPALAQLVTTERQRLGGFSSVKQAGAVSLFAAPEAKSRAREAITKTGLDVNSAGLADFERGLGLATPLARRLVAWRDAQPGGQVKSPAQLLSAPAIDERAFAAQGNRLIVRGPASVFWQLGVHAGVLLLAAILAPALLRGRGVKGDPFLVPLSILLAGLGVIVLFSLHDPLRDRPDYIHQARGVMMGLLALLAGALMPARPTGARWLPARSNLRRYTYVWALAAIGLTAALFIAGHGPAGVRLSLGFFQPVEIVKLLLVLFVAGYLTERGDLLADALHRWRPPLPKGWAAKFRGISVPRRQDGAPIAVMFGLAMLLFLIVRDMGPALLLFGVFLAMLYMASGRSGIAWVGLLLVLAGGFVAYKAHVGVLPVRIDMWRAPWENPHPNGMQLGQAYWAMATGGVQGSGLGLGAPGQIPRGRDDLVFASLSEELGLLGALAVLALYVVLVGRGLRAALRAQSDFDRLLAGGLAAMLGAQTFLILAGVTGLLPLTGITLPFVSYGDTSLIADFLLLGVLRGISTPADSVAVGARNPLFRRTVRNLATVAAVAILGFVGLGRLVWLQAIAADETAGHAIKTPDADNVARAKINPRLLALAHSIPRGSIYDRAGKLLATSRLDEISRQMEDDQAAARRYYRKGRYYPLGEVAAHIVGYLDPGLGGPTGIEKEYDRTLRGFGSFAELTPEYRGKDLPGWLGGARPRTGHDVTLTLDAGLQEDAFKLMKQAANSLSDERTGKRKERAAAVFLDPLTGELLASVSLPSFNPNTLTLERWAKMNADPSGAAKLFDRARFGGYPPGSSLKVATAAAGLEEGLDPTYDCNHVAHDLRWTWRGSVYGRKQLADDRGDPPHEHIKMARAIKVSCNLYFANLGLVLGPQRLRAQLADRFEMRGVRPLDQFAVDLPLNAFGQGTMTASPLEMARIAGSVANQGRMMKVQTMLAVKGTDQKLTPVIASRPIGEQNARALAAMMREVVTGGTAHGVFDALPVEVAGKTGTAQTEQGDGQPHSWFIGYTPFSRPKYAFAAVIENGGYGKQGAAPALARILRTKFGP